MNEQELQEQGDEVQGTYRDNQREQWLAELQEVNKQLQAENEKLKELLCRCQAEITLPILSKDIKELLAEKALKGKENDQNRRNSRNWEDVDRYYCRRY